MNINIDDNDDGNKSLEALLLLKCCKCKQSTVHLPSMKAVVIPSYVEKFSIKLSQTADVTNKTYKIDDGQ